jgi:hypothetical protein
MADWKKVVVSGSAISQLDNDANYLSTTGGGIISASAEGDAQGQIKLNGVNIDANSLGTTDSPTFVTVTAALTGNVTGTADTASYVAVGNIDGEIVATTASYVAAAYDSISVSDATITITDMAGNDDAITVNNVVAANSASYVAFAGVDGLTAFSSSVAGAIQDTAFDLTFAADGGTDDVIADGDTVTFAGGTNITSAVTNNQIAFALDANISLTSVTASVKGNVAGNVVGDVTGDVTGNADTATALESAITIGGTSFDGTANIVPDNANTASYVAVANIDGDITAVTASLALAAETLVSSATGVNLTLTGDLTVQGTTTALDTTNLEVKDQFISINDGGGSADGGLVVDGAGVSYGWDSSESRWAFDAAGATKGQTTISADAYAVAAVTSDVAAYRKNGNIRVESGDIYIYVE